MTHASVFSGIGGPEVAATMLGWENLFHCEINPFTAADSTSRRRERREVQCEIQFGDSYALKS